MHFPALVWSALISVRLLDVYYHLLEACLSYVSVAVVKTKAFFWPTNQSHRPSSGKERRQELEATGHSVSTVRKKQAMTFFICGLWPKPQEWSCPPIVWVLPSRLTEDKLTPVASGALSPRWFQFLPSWQSTLPATGCSVAVPLRQNIPSCREAPEAGR